MSPSIQTQPAFIHHGTWDDTTRQHPAMKWMEEYTLDFDKHPHQSLVAKWYSKDWTLHKADGTYAHGRDHGIAALNEIYGPFTAHFHEPYFLVCHDVADGWDMIGQARLFGNLDGQPAAGEKKAKDRQGREWDVGVPAGFHFHYVKDDKADGGMVLKKTEIMADSGVPMGVMLKRGLIKAKDLGL